MQKKKKKSSLTTDKKENATKLELVNKVIVILLHFLLKEMRLGLLLIWSCHFISMSHIFCLTDYDNAKPYFLRKQ